MISLIKDFTGGKTYEKNQSYWLDVIILGNAFRLLRWERRKGLSV